MTVKERPTGITILVILQAVGGILPLIGGLGPMFLSTFITGFLPGLPDVPAGVPNVVSGMLTLVAGVMVTFALIDFFIAWGLWAGKGWAWIIAMILGVLGVIAGLLTLPIGIISIIIQGLKIYYLTRPHVKGFFGRGAPPPPTPPAVGPI